MITWETLSGWAKAVVKLWPKHKSDPGPTIIMAKGSTLNWHPKVYNISEPKTFKLPKPPEA